MDALGRILESLKTYLPFLTVLLGHRLAARLAA
jgi:hypothetical protein